MSNSTRNIIAWVIQVLLGIAFIMGGFQKVSHMAETVKNFSDLGYPGWLAYLVGGGELLGGIGLLVPATVRLAASGLIIIMIGAIFTHATKIPGGLLPATTDKGFQPNGLPATLFLVLLVVLLWLRRPAPSTTV